MKLKEHKDGYKEVIMFCDLYGEDYWNAQMLDDCIPGYDTEPSDKETLSKDFKKAIVVYKIIGPWGSRCYEFWSNPCTLECYVKEFWLGKVKETPRYKTIKGVKYYFQNIDFSFKKIHNPEEVCHSILWRWFK